MPTECSAEPVRVELFEFGPVEGRAVVSCAFDIGIALFRSCHYVRHRCMLARNQSDH